MKQSTPINQIYNCFKFIQSDLYRYTGQINLKSFLKQYYHRGEGFKFTVWLRICHFSYNQKILRLLVFPFARVLYKHYKYKYGYDIPYECDIGPGLLIYHFGGIVFVPQKCGKNVTISHTTTVGMKIYNGLKKYPVLKDNVYLAPGAKIIGNVIVESNTAIGTNSVLLENTEENSIIIGIPGKAVSHKGSYTYVNNPI